VLSVSPLELSADEETRRVYETNVFGVLRLTQKFLPTLRQAKGRIINISSMVGGYGVVWGPWAETGGGHRVCDVERLVCVCVCVCVPGRLPDGAPRGRLLVHQARARGHLGAQHTTTHHPAASTSAFIASS
jgi:NAD(P)-dependent dehydrogenase (short-subunit alcohol dehydrogenase family)